MNIWKSTRNFEWHCIAILSPSAYYQYIWTPEFEILVTDDGMTSQNLIACTEIMLSTSHEPEMSLMGGLTKWLWQEALMKLDCLFQPILMPSCLAKCKRRHTKSRTLFETVCIDFLKKNLSFNKPKQKALFYKVGYFWKLSCLKANEIVQNFSIFFFYFLFFILIQSNRRNKNYSSMNGLLIRHCVWSHVDQKLKKKEDFLNLFTFWLALWTWFLSRRYFGFSAKI